MDLESIDTRLPFIPAHYFKFDEVEDESPAKIPIKSLNKHLVCSLCKGYFIDATAIVECLHTFCKSCIVKYFQTENDCPVCRIKVHETCPFASLQTDRTLQDLVYKIFPQIAKDEENRRIEFYRTHGALPNNAESVVFRSGKKFQKRITPVMYDLEPATDGHAYDNDRLVPFLLEGRVPLRYVNDLIQTSNFDDGGPTLASGCLVKKYVRCPERAQVQHLVTVIRQRFVKTPITSATVPGVSITLANGQSLDPLFTIKRASLMALLADDTVDDESELGEGYFKLKFVVGNDSLSAT